MFLSLNTTMAKKEVVTLDEMKSVNADTKRKAKICLGIGIAGTAASIGGIAVVAKTVSDNWDSLETSQKVCYGISAGCFAAGAVFGVKTIHDSCVLLGKIKENDAKLLKELDE